MYAVKGTNLNNGNVHYTSCRDYADACDTRRRVIREMEDADWIEGEMEDADWIEGEDFTAEITEVDDDFDFDNQPDWN